MAERFSGPLAPNVLELPAGNARRAQGAAPDRAGPEAGSIAGRGERPFVLTLWTDDPALAAEADRAGVDRIGVDLERRGKRRRQAGLATWISPHRPASLTAIGERLTRAELFARVNPMSASTAGEVERLLSLGVEVLMLPMFRSADEVAAFAAVVDGRATVVPLLETSEAAAEVSRIAAVPGIGEIHVGINDLALSLGARNRFEVLDGVLLQRISSSVREAGLRLGIGGIGRVDDRSLPISADLIYAQYARLGAGAALLSRAFTQRPPGSGALAEDLTRGRARLAHWARAGAAELDEARTAFRAALTRASCW